jgi:hypothetical protein
MNNRIFISSTCFDLIDLRAELKKYLEAVGLTPIMSDQLDSKFETFQSQNSIQTCLINLHSCDTVVIILSQRYGSNLLKWGFGDYSATHLEYLEAKKTKKRILFFVRDRLLADFTQYKNNKKIDTPSWIEKKDIKIFDMISDRKTLANKGIDNWLFVFRDVLDVKERLGIELKREIKSTRLDKMIESGNTPLVTVTTTASTVPNSKDIWLSFRGNNVGNQTAIEPHLLLFKAKTYKQVLEEEHLKIYGGYELFTLEPLIAGGSFPDTQVLNVVISDEEYKQNEAYFVVVVIYKTIHGDLIADASEVTIRLLLRPTKIEVITKFTTKHNMDEQAFEKMNGLYNNHENKKTKQ